MEILFCTNRWFCSPRSLSLFYKFRSLRSLSVGMATVAAAPLGHEVPLRQFSAVLGLLGGHSCEERVAGLLITSKTFDRLKGSMSAAQEELLLRDVVDAVSVRFIIRMLTTHTDATDGQMKAAAMNILRVATGYRSIASKFIVYASTLVNELALRDVSFTPDAIEILLSLSNLDTSIANQARNAALKRISSSQNISSPRGVRIILRFIVDLPHSPPEGLVLPRDVAVGLRSMWPQWLHGAADLDTRESAYDLLQYIFRVADPSWTVGSCTNKGNTGEFASFLATIVCGDIRIFFEEHLSFYYAACQGTDRLSTYLPERHQSRIASCFSIIDSMLYFLIGDVGADDGTEPLWGGLPSSALLAIQKVWMHHCSQ